jgi:hypothetical protein
MSRKILLSFSTLFALAACQAGNSQAPVTGNSGAQDRKIGQYMLRQLQDYPRCNQYVLGDRMAQITLGDVTLPFFWNGVPGACPNAHPINRGPVHVVDQPLSYLPTGTTQGLWAGKPHFAIRQPNGTFCRGEEMPISCPNWFKPR